MESLNVDHIVYEGSHFLPALEPISLLNITAHRHERKTPWIVALALEVCRIGMEQNKKHEILAEYLEYTGIHPTNIDNYLFGFTTAPYLIIGTRLISILPYQEAVRTLFGVTTNQIQIKFNQYIINLIHNKAQRIYDPRTEPISVIVPIHETALTIPFCDDIYFTAGVIASQKTFIKLNNALPPTTTL